MLFNTLFLGFSFSDTNWFSFAAVSSSQELHEPLLCIHFSFQFSNPAHGVPQ